MSPARGTGAKARPYNGPEDSKPLRGEKRRYLPSYARTASNVFREDAEALRPGEHVELGITGVQIDTTIRDKAFRFTLGTEELAVALGVTSNWLRQSDLFKPDIHFVRPDKTGWRRWDPQATFDTIQKLSPARNSPQLSPHARRSREARLALIRSIADRTGQSLGNLLRHELRPTDLEAEIEGLTLERLAELLAFSVALAIEPCMQSADLDEVAPVAHIAALGAILAAALGMELPTDASLADRLHELDAPFDEAEGQEADHG